MAAWVALLLLVIAGVALLMRADVGSIAGYDPSDFALVVAGLALLIFIASSVAGSYRGRAGQALRDLLVWSLLGAVLIAGYNYRERIVSLGYHVLGDLLPPDSSLLRADTQTEQERSERIRKRPDGHFMVRAEANGTSLAMLVDTGASTVVLRPEDGRRLGFDVDQLRYVVPVQTANGTAYAASIRLTTLSIGKIKVNNVEALVARRGTLRENLLGMSFLNRLNSYEFSGEYLTLRKL
jgi:aspartyl protease family protein